MKIQVSIPCYKDVAVPFMESLCQLLMGGPRLVTPGLEGVGVAYEEGTILPLNRHNLVVRAIESGYTHLLWLDTDMSFPAETLQQLAKHQAPIVGTNIAQRHAPHVPMSLVGGESVYTRQESTGLQTVDTTSLSVCLTSVDVFHKIGVPYFRYDFLEGTRWRGEDRVFFDRARDAGYAIAIDHDLTKRIHHHAAIPLGCEWSLISEGRPAVAG